MATEQGTYYTANIHLIEEIEVIKQNLLFLIDSYYFCFKNEKVKLYQVSKEIADEKLYQSGKL